MAKVGRPKAFKSANELLQHFKDYVKKVKSNPRMVQDYVGKDATMVWREREVPLTMEGFENYCYEVGAINDLSDYLRNRDGRYEEFTEVCSHIKRTIRQDQIEGGMVSIYNPSITQRLNGLADKKEHDVKGTLNIPQLPDIADRK